jgi:SAM-dependent methyltransferase
MLDPVLLSRFKSISREDEQIADLIVRSIPVRNVQSVLDVGAGVGLISRRIATAVDGPVSIHVLEPELKYTYPPAVTVYRTRWEDAQKLGRYDLILMSHVSGHFIQNDRGDVIARAIDHLSHKGILVIVENAPIEPFWSLNLQLGRLQSTQYIVDFEDLEAALLRRNTVVHRIDHTIPLYMGETMAERLELVNIFFPCPFSATELALVRSHWNELFPFSDAIMPLTQRFYFVSA